MTPLLASQLLYDTDEDILFEVDELLCEQNWVSARIYKTIKDDSTHYEVWLFEWDPETNEEKSSFFQTFQIFEEAKSFAIQYLQDKNGLERAR